MFRGTSLTSFSVALPSLTDGSSMFRGTSLTSFSVALPSLTNGFGMFQECYKLTSFSGDLSSLTDGRSMFDSARLDKQSVVGIITCLRERNTCSTSAQLDIRIDSQYMNDPELLEVLGITEFASTVSIVGHGGGTWTINLTTF